MSDARGRALQNALAAYLTRWWPHAESAGAGRPGKDAVMTHRCPGPRCTHQVDDNMLMCGRHWRMVPAPLQRAVWAAWRNGEGRYSPEHTAAIEAAIRSVNPRD